MKVVDMIFVAIVAVLLAMRFGRWWRHGLVFYVHATAGNDSADGSHANDPLRTLAETFRRIGPTITMGRVVTVYLMSDFPASDPLIVTVRLGRWAKLHFKGGV